MKNFLLLFLCGTMFLPASSDVEILGLRVYGNNDEYLPPIITQNEVVTIEFDVTTVHPPNLQIIFKHVSKEWRVDENSFVNPPEKLRTDYLAYTVAPQGVYQYTFRYKNSFPNQRNNVKFTFSGKYIFSIIDREANDEVLATGKFIVVEETVPSTMTIENKYDPNAVSPMNQVNVITVSIQAPQEFRANDPVGIYHADIKMVEIIKNWILDRPHRIDIDDRNPDTFVEDFLTPQKKFWIRNVPLGNEYRRLDLSNTTMYPNRQLAILKDGPDVSRYQWQGKPDANGASKLKPFVGANSDYLEVEMRLRLPQKLEKNIYVTGGFTNWELLPEYAMEFDTVTQLYKFRFWVRRGVYDYQYVLGVEDENGKIIEDDWFALEGNDWRTINRLVALVFYNDRRFGGFDRIVGFVRGRNPGGGNGEKTSFQNPPMSSSPVLIPMGK